MNNKPRLNPAQDSGAVLCAAKGFPLLIRFFNKAFFFRYVINSVKAER